MEGQIVCSSDFVIRHSFGIRDSVFGFCYWPCIGPSQRLSSLKPAWNQPANHGHESAPFLLFRGGLLCIRKPGSFAVVHVPHVTWIGGSQRRERGDDLR